MSDTTPPTSSSPPPASPPPHAPHVSDEVKAQAKGLVGSLLDFSFDTFVTPKIVTVLQALMLLGVALSALTFLVTSFAAGVTGILIGLVVAPTMLVLGIVIARVYVEIIMLAFKILETLQRIESKQPPR